MNFFDLHTDIPLKINSSAKSKSVVDLSGKQFGNYAQFAAIWIDDLDPLGSKTFKIRLNNFKRFLKHNNLSLSLPGRKNGIFLSLENGVFLAESSNLLDEAFSEGIRLVSLSWNMENALAGGCKSNGSITKKGMEIISRLNNKNMVLDISHLNKKSALKAIEVAENFISSHSNACGVYNHLRNLDDETLLLLKQKNGIMGLCFYPEFLGHGDIFLNVAKNISYLINLGMENNISIGTDFDGGEMNNRLCKTSDLPILYNYLKNFGFSGETLNKIFYSNALDFFTRVCNY